VTRVRATRAYIAGFGTADSLLAGGGHSVRARERRRVVPRLADDRCQPSASTVVLAKRHATATNSPFVRRVTVIAAAGGTAPGGVAAGGAAGGARVRLRVRARPSPRRGRAGGPARGSPAPIWLRRRWRVRRPRRRGPVSNRGGGEHRRTRRLRRLLDGHHRDRDPRERRLERQLDARQHRPQRRPPGRRRRQRGHERCGIDAQCSREVARRSPRRRPVATPTAPAR
jgi:hypothetical protein